ncbi:MAG: zinc-ribbon domain containing protein [Planctomycetota bacterium]|nr:zinc-ribbon domain containing protein [Planctomycetota bacterium]
MDIFGSTSPELMPPHFFMCGTYVSLDYGNVLRADIDRQNYTVAPRHWYVDTTIVCRDCGAEFLFSMNEQRVWYEEYRFIVDSFPNRCKSCRFDQREMKRLRQEYDESIVSATTTSCVDVELKRTLVAVIERLVDFGIDVPSRILERRDVLFAQIRKLEPTENSTGDELHS